MPGDSVAIVGRQLEFAAVDDYAGTPALVLVRGGIGSGKTTLLGGIHRAWQAKGFTVVRLAYPGSFEHWDEFGAQVALDCIRNTFHEIGDARVADALAAVDRAVGAETYSSARARSRLFADLVRLFRCLQNKGPLAVLADDVHAASHPALAVAAMQEAGCTVVATCLDDGIAAEPTTLSAIASRVLDLAPLPDDRIDEVLAAASPGRLDASVGPALRAGLGSLAGNPGTMLEIFDRLWLDGRFTEVQGYFCLSPGAVPAALPRDHHLVGQVSRFGAAGAQLVALIQAVDRFSVDNLLNFAAATGRDLESCGRMVDLLATAGVLDYDNDGILTIPCPALVPTVLEELRPEDIASLHRTIAEQLLQDGKEQVSQPAVVADHIALAGAALPQDPALVAFVEREAARVLRVKPLLAARWYRAALRHCPAGGQDHGRILETVLRLLVRLAQYESLSEVVVETVDTGAGDDLCYELSVAAAMAAVHIGVPVSPPVHRRLACDARGRAPLELADAWFSGQVAITNQMLESAFGPFRSEGPLTPERARRLADPDVQDDPVERFKLILGDEYGEPQHGPLAIFRRLAHAYAEGRWQGLPSEARQLELAGSPTVVQQISRILVAEVLTTSGEHVGAAHWLDQVDSDCAFPALRAWVELGILYKSEGPESVRKRGWALYPEITATVGEGDVAGLRSFLVRLASTEMTEGDAEQLQVICDDAKRWYARHGGNYLRLTDLMLRGLAERDYAAAREAVEIARTRVDVSELMRALLVVAFIAEEPRPWYHEAYEIIRSLGGDWMRMHIKTFMRGSGVAEPARRADRELLTDVEKHMIGLIQQSLTNRQIAGVLQVSEKTVENYLTRLFAKTACRSRLDLVTASLEGRLAVKVPA